MSAAEWADVLAAGILTLPLAIALYVWPWPREDDD